MKYRRSRSFNGLLDGYHGISQGTRSGLGESEDEEGEESVEEEEPKQTKVEASLKGPTEAAEAPSIALSTQTLVSQAEQNFLKMME
ncbi:hypothetical protein O181_078791 [Austropuccinia psidii MF-1]|uniref:Uncharacterized protein n=1 Tax=Austropuccinia psidii MF-1 TaxID=1389203 RepID=A0A9Q3FKN2_9BASI|nr:hypothetical protein [Austropuccinia psidii MF-1]